MDRDRYDLRVSQNRTIYMFDSLGRHGRIAKLISFDPVIMPELEDLGFADVYNLGFGDYEWHTGNLDDKVKSNNGDRDKVLATVAFAALDFLGKNPSVTLYAIGSMPERTRLYQMGLNRHYDEIVLNYVIWGRLGNDWQRFEQKVNYEAFLLQKK